MAWMQQASVLPPSCGANDLEADSVVVGRLPSPKILRASILPVVFEMKLAERQES